MNFWTPFPRRGAPKIPFASFLVFLTFFLIFSYGFGQLPFLAPFFYGPAVSCARRVCGAARTFPLDRASRNSLRGGGRTHTARPVAALRRVPMTRLDPPIHPRPPPGRGPCTTLTLPLTRAAVQDLVQG